MSGTVTFQGKPLSLVGRTIRENTKAPNFRALSNDLGEVGLIDFKNKIKIITSFPSLDTPVCDLQVKEFNNRAQKTSPDIAIVGISKDLPFAQKRFCQLNAVNNITILSDYRFSSFGIQYGLLIKELNLLARAVLIVDATDVVRYVQIVDEITNAPRYEEVISHLNEIIKKPAQALEEDMPSQCKPCEGGVPPLPQDKINALLAQYRGWELIEGKKIRKEFKYKDFIEAKYMLDLVSLIAQEQGHHPTVVLSYNKLKITLTTHASGGLTENDFIMAKIIDEL
jgi:thiol peroxidase